MPEKQDRETKKREARRASEEHGGGESEGFEQAEERLREEAENFDAGHNPAAVQPVDEAPGTDPDVYGEGDEIESTETDETTQGTPGDLDRSAEKPD